MSMLKLRRQIKTEVLTMNFKLAAFADEADSRISEQIKAMMENDIPYSYLIPLLPN